MAQNDLQRNILDAIRLSRQPQGNISPSPRTFIFNEPGNAYQQKTPMVEAPSGGNKTVGIESNAEMQALMQYLQKMMKQINQKKQWQLIMKNMLPMLQGRAGKANIQGGPFMKPSGQSGKPEFGAMLQGRIPF